MTWPCKKQYDQFTVNNLQIVQTSDCILPNVKTSPLEEIELHCAYSYAIIVYLILYYLKLKKKKKKKHASSHCHFTLGDMCGYL